MTQFNARHKNARISAQKVRPLANLVRGMYADEALDTLKYQPQRGARMLEKVIKSAVGNAQDPDQNNGRSHRIEELVLTEVCIDGGPMFKRIRPRARGSAFPIKKRSSHIRVSLMPIDEL
jgi:large subunit ribosomal protein L22